MKIKEIRIVTEIENIYNKGIEVIITLDDGFSYAINVVTPQYMIYLMKEGNQNFLEPGENFIVVKKLTPKIIEESVRLFVEENNAYWLKLFYISAYFDIATLNNLKDKIISKYHLDD
jgi:hypothetical protein